MSKKNGKPLETIPVKFGGVVIGVDVKIPIEIKASDANPVRVHDLFRGDKLIKGSIVARPEGCHAAQNGMFGDDGDLTLHGTFETAGYHADVKKFSLALTNETINFEALKFRGRNGLLRIEQLIDREAPGDKSAEEPQVQEAVA